MNSTGGTMALPGSRMLPHIFLAGLLLSGCECNGDGDDDDGGVPDAQVDSEVPDAPPTEPDASGKPCQTDEDCADGIDCTVDRCDPEGMTCEVTPNDDLCADDRYCNGDERCSPTEGCVPGPSRACNDDNVCTIDMCDEAQGCIHRGRDFDGDGHDDWHCEGGDDCNDGDARIYVGAPEICADMVDNNCDGLTDFEPGANCTNPGFDTCEEPFDITGGGAFEISLAGTVRDYAISCGWGTTNDVVLTFTLDEPADVEIMAESEFVLTSIALETECGAEGTELECELGFPARIRTRSLDAGTYYVIVQAQSNADVLVTLEISDPTPPPANETCDGAVDVSAGGRFEGSFVDIVDDHDVSCGFGYPELVYVFTIEETSDVDVTASAGFNFVPMAVETSCGDPESEVRCSYSAPSHQHLYSLEPGTYYVLVEGPGEFDFTLDVAIGPPTSPPEGDMCDGAIDVSGGGSFDGTLVGMQDDIEVSCGFSQIEQVFFIDLEEPQDVTLRVEGDGGEWMTVAIQDVCGDEDSEPNRACAGGNPAALRVRELAAGPHWIVVESFSATDFTLDVTLADPSPPVEVELAETCAEGWETGTNGGLFVGNTDDADDDYAATCGGQAPGPDEAYFLSLLFSARLSITLDPDGWDGVLHLHETDCVGADNEIMCNDNWIGDNSVIQLNVDAANFYIIVDGRTEDDHGPYTLDVLVTPNG